ncbi:leucyl aminopeptidase [bacterium]|nr:leucyl aminopeptidase [bacterium]
MVNIDVRDIAPWDVEAQLFIAGYFEGEQPAENSLGRLDTALGGQISLAVKQGDFTGEREERLILYGSRQTGMRRLMLVGLGKRDDWTAEGIRRAFGQAGRYARDCKLTNIALMPPLTGMNGKDEELVTVAAVEGAVLATYRYAKIRKVDPDDYRTPEEFTLIPGESDKLEGLRRGAETAKVTIDGAWFARDLVATPGMDLYPEAYGALAKELESEHIKVDVLTVDRLKELGMGALLAVGQGSTRPPVLIHLTYDPGIENAKTIAIVGKGITFDAGGLDLKSAAGMRDMKIDMGGSAAVMGVFKALDRWKPKCRVEGFIPAAENMPDGNAFRPGDILISYKGLSIEIDNTDAEGRLGLADALAYACETVHPDAMVDLATLTGACWIALGNHATGMMGTSDDLAERLSTSGERTGERVWRLPLWNDYLKQTKSEVADLKNTGGRPGGAITAGIFLKQFVDDEVPWIHLDIAGTASEGKVSYAPHKELPTGVGVRLLLDLLRSWPDDE